MLITRQQIIDIFTAIRDALIAIRTTDGIKKIDETVTVDGAVNSTVQNWPVSQTVDGTVGVNSLPSIPAGANAIGSVDVDNFPTDIEVEGTAAHDAAASGNPIQAGGVYRVADPTLDDGDAGSLRVNAKGELITEAQLTGSNAAVHESLTVDATGGGVGFVGHAANRYALITAETAQVRFTIDGTAPTTTVGHLLNPGDVLKLDSNADITAFRAIRTGATSGVLKATFSGGA